MKVIGVDSIFSEEVLSELPINYRFMTKVESSTFGEHYEGRRFSQSVRHQSNKYLTVRAYKPMSNIVAQDYLNSYEK